MSNVDLSVVRYSNTSLRYSTNGDLGSGKTLDLVREAGWVHKYFPDLPIFSNIELFSVPYKPVLSASVLFELEKPCFLLLDELWHMVDSHRSMSLVNNVLSLLLLRSRKRNWRVGYSQQWVTQTDLRVRFVTEVAIFPQMHRGEIVYEAGFNKFMDFIGDVKFCAYPFYSDYDSCADPFTLNVAELKEGYERWLKDHNLHVRDPWFRQYIRDMQGLDDSEEEVSE